MPVSRLFFFAICSALLVGISCDDDAWEGIECGDVSKVLDMDEKCLFIQNNPDCAIDSGYINYLESLYCTFKEPALQPVGYVVLIVAFLLFLLAMAITSDRIFTPNLATIAQALHFSENVAGETLLPLGNGAPDIFTSIAAALSLKDGDVGVLYGTLLGSGAFTLSVIVAVVILIKPFRTMERPLLRTMIFYIMAVFCAFAVIWDGVITVIEASIFLIMYVVYLITVLTAPIINRKLIEWAAKRRKENDGVKEEGSHQTVTVQADMSPLPPALVTPVVMVQTHPPPPVITLNDDIAPTSPMDPNPPRPNFLDIPSDDRRLIRLNTFDPSTRKPTAASADQSQRTRSLSVSSPKVVVEHDDHRAHHRGHERRPSEDQAQLSRIARQLIRVSSAQQEESRKLREQMMLSVDQRPSQESSRNVSRRSSGKGFTASSLHVDSELGDRTRSLSKLETFLMPEPDDDIELRVPETSGNNLELRRMSSNQRPQHGHTLSPVMESIPVVEEKKSDDSSEKSDEEIVDMPYWRWLLAGLNPIEMDAWKEENWFWCVFQCIKAPILFFVLLTNPLLDEEKPNMNWNRPLNSLHCITTPLFIMFAFNTITDLIEDVFPIAVVVGLCGFGLGALVFMTTENIVRPGYHIVFAVAGFITTAMWIYLFANEVVNLITCFGIALSISPAILAMSFLAWGNCLGDFINDTTVARQGYSKMAISACFSSALFNMLLGLGLPLMIVTLNEGGELKASLPDELLLMFGLLMVILISSYIGIPLIQGFYVRRPYSVYLIILYVGGLTCAILAELDIIVLRS